MASEYGMGIRISPADYFPVSIYKCMGALRGGDGVHHHGKVAAGRILHPHWYVETAGCESVGLVFNRPGSDGYVDQQVAQVSVLLRIEHLVGAEKVGFLHSSDISFPYGNDASEHVLVHRRIRLVKHALVTHSRGAWLVGIDSRYDADFFFYLVLHFSQSGQIIQNGVLVVCRAWPYEKDELIFPAC